MSNIKNQMSKVERWVKKNRFEAVLLATILLLGAFFRLYRIDEYMTFLGDEGRDVIVVRRLLVDFDPILIGPRTSIGDMYLGPLYYYLIAPALFIANFSPAGPAVMIALFGVGTIFFVWRVAREWFGRFAAFVAALLYSFAPTVIIYSRSSWNPNIMPFFALLMIYGIWRMWRYLEWRWLVVLGVSYAFILQSHYLGLLLAPIIGFFWLVTFVKVKNEKLGLSKFWKKSLIGFVLFLFLMSPLVIFDARHGWRNFSSMKVFFTQRQTTLSAHPWTAIPKLFPIWEQIVTRLVTGYQASFGRMIAYFTVLFVFVYLLKKASKLKSVLFTKGRDRSFSAFILIIMWLGVSLVGLGVYKQHVYDHYFGFFFPVPFLFLGGIVQAFHNKSKIFSSLLFIAVILPLVFVNLASNPLKYPPNRQMQRTQEIANKIRDEADGERLNLAVIAERNYEDAYQYFLERWRVGVVDIDPQRSDETITNQLFVVCELEDKSQCDPTHSPKAEIASFGWSEIEGEWLIGGVTLYRLVHY